MRKNKCLKDTSIESVFIVTYHYLDDACSELLLLVATSSSNENITSALGRINAYLDVLGFLLEPLRFERIQDAIKKMHFHTDNIKAVDELFSVDKRVDIKHMKMLLNTLYAH